MPCFLLSATFLTTALLGVSPKLYYDKVLQGPRMPRMGVGATLADLRVRFGYALSAYVYLDIAQRSWKSVRGQLLGMPEVDHVALVSGAHDILLRVRARDTASLRDVVITRLQEIPEVRATQTVLIFDEAAPALQPRQRTPEP